MPSDTPGDNTADDRPVVVDDDAGGMTRPDNESITDTVTSLSEATDVNGVVEQLTALPFIDRVSYQTENGIDTTPAIITVYPTDDALTEQLELVGAITNIVVQELVRAEVKASIEHPLERVTDEDGEVIDLDVNEDEWTVSIRWNSRMATTPDDVRYEGYAITPDTISDLDVSKLDP